MANQLQKGYVFVDGNVVNAAALNNLVDLATALGGLISTPGSVTPTGTDQVLLLRGTALQRALVSGLPSGVTSVSTVIDTGASVLQFTVSGGSGATPVFHIGLDPQGPNKVLVGPVSGAGTTPTFRLLAPKDLTLPTAPSGAFGTIDWSASNVFGKVMPDNNVHHFAFSNVTDGQTIRVRVQQFGSSGGTATAHWDNVDYWRGGSEPVLSTGPSVKDIYTFTAIGTTVYGHSDKLFS